MSFSITGIQAIPSTYSFASADPASGGSIRPLSNKNTSDNGYNVNPTANGTVSVSTPDKFKVFSLPSTDTPHAGSTPAKAPGVVEPLDKVTLTTQQKVRDLQQQGAGEAQIAASLNLPLKEVQSDLHIQSQTQQHLSFTVAPVVSALQANPLAAVSASA